MDARSPLDLFIATCTPASDLYRVRELLVGKGWQDFIPPGHHPVGSLLKIGRAATANTSKFFEVLRSTFGVEELVVILVRAEIEEAWSNGCRLYGTVIGSAPSKSEITARIGRVASLRSEHLGATSVTWEPGWSAGDDPLELIVAPPQSEMAHVSGFSGWALVAQAVRE